MSARMMHFHTVDEALELLRRETGTNLSESEFFDLAVNCDVSLLGARPASEMPRVEIRTFEGGEFPLKSTRSGFHMAVLYQIHVAELWATNETTTVHARARTREDEHAWFAEPVCITKAEVRVPREALERLLHALRRTPTLPNGGDARRALQWPASTSNADAATIKEWVTLARRYADEAWTNRPTGTNPSKGVIGDRVAKRFRDEGCHQFAGSYITRHALNGWQRPVK